MGGGGGEAGVEVGVRDGGGGRGGGGGGVELGGGVEVTEGWRWG